MTHDVSAILAEHGRLVSSFLSDALKARHDAPPRLIEAIDYSLSAGGKRLRPALILETFGACRANEADIRSERSAIACAAAMELIHTFSLVHDDLPAMDNDDFRRGRPTNHKVFGEAMAILAGDGMMTLAFELLAEHVEADLVPATVLELSRAAGPAGMIGGQVLDIAGENQSLDLTQLQQIHRLKTGALLTASCRLGAICARAPSPVLDAVGRFGQHLGLAFQITDDLLDETASAEQMGKAVRKDREKGKNTYPALLGLDASREEASRQTALATEALSVLSTKGDRLLALARFVVERQH